MDLIRRETRHVTGVSESLGGPATRRAATALRRAARHEGGGRAAVGRRPPSRAATCASAASARSASPSSATCIEERARVTVADVDARRRSTAVVEPTSASRCVAGRESTPIDCDVYSPCALGARPRRRRPSPSSAARRWSGRPTTSSPTPQMRQRLDRAGVLYAPDYVVNAGGVINIAEELGRLPPERCRRGRPPDLRHHVRRVLEPPRQTRTAITARSSGRRSRMAEQPASPTSGAARLDPHVPGAGAQPVAQVPVPTRRPVGAAPARPPHRARAHRRRPGRHVPHDPPGRGVLDQKIWGLNRMGKAAFVVSAARATRAPRSARPGRSAAGHDVVLPYYRDTRRDAHARDDRRRRSCWPSSPGADDPNSRRPADAEPLGLARAGNVITGSSPIATQLPHAAGIGLAAKLRRRGQVVGQLLRRRGRRPRATSTRR